jgi:hypothetical protein
MSTIASIPLKGNTLSEHPKKKKLSKKDSLIKNLDS